jgi:hypothetical protein
VVPSRMCNGIKIAHNLGSSDSFGLRCEETGKARLPAKNPTTSANSPALALRTDKYMST